MSGFFEIQSDVQEFMEASGQLPPCKDTVQLYANLVKEEIKELEVALNNNDPVETLDAIADSIWVLIGLAIAARLPLPQAWSEVARSNLAKIDATTKTVIKSTATGKVQKPLGWTPPNIKRLVDLYGRAELISLSGDRDE